jgi:hypothetical protein
MRTAPKKFVSSCALASSTLVSSAAPVAAYPLRLLEWQRIQPCVQIRPQPHPVAPHVRIVLDAVLVPLEPNRGIEVGHSDVQRWLLGIVMGIGGAESRVFERRSARYRA